MQKENNNNNSGFFLSRASNDQRGGKLWMLFDEKLLHKNGRIQICNCNVIYFCGC